VASSSYLHCLFYVHVSADGASQVDETACVLKESCCLRRDTLCDNPDVVSNLY
jgi:hypothetical protein